MLYAHEEPLKRELMLELGLGYHTLMCKRGCLRDDGVQNIVSFVDKAWKYNNTLRRAMNWTVSWNGCIENQHTGWATLEG